MVLCCRFRFSDGKFQYHLISDLPRCCTLRSVSVLRVLAKQHQRNVREKEAKRRAKEAKLARKSGKARTPSSEEQTPEGEADTGQRNASSEDQQETPAAEDGSWENGADDLRPGVKCEVHACSFLFYTLFAF